MTQYSHPKYGTVLRTPDSAFANLPDYPFAPNYMEVDGLRLHYVDEGTADKGTIFLMHGQPSWSYLYRHMIPQFVAAGYRVIAPDLIGFGKSDKPAQAKIYSYQAHVHWISRFVEQLGVTGADAFFQDWGGMIGLRVMEQHPTWIRRMAVANTALSDVKGPMAFALPNILRLMRLFAGKPTISDLAGKQNYGNWAGYFKHAGKIEIGKVMQILTTKTLTTAERAAYDAPFPDSRYHAATRVMPQIVATQLKEAQGAWAHLRQSQVPTLVLFSDNDPFLAGQGIDAQFKALPGAAGQPHAEIRNASHFLQEDAGADLSRRVLHWLAAGAERRAA